MKRFPDSLTYWVIAITEAIRPLIMKNYVLRNESVKFDLWRDLGKNVLFVGRLLFYKTGWSRKPRIQIMKGKLCKGSHLGWINDLDLSWPREWHKIKQQTLTLLFTPQGVTNTKLLLNYITFVVQMRSNLKIKAWSDSNYSLNVMI